MKKHNLILLCSFGVELFFEMFGYGGKMITPFPAVSDSLYAQLYAYFVCEHISFIMLSVVMYMVAKSPPKSLTTIFSFALLKASDFTEFMLTDSRAWYRFKIFSFSYDDVPISVTFPMSWNLIQITTFAIICFIDERNGNKIR
jgi:hypothetical protein